MVIVVIVKLSYFSPLPCVDQLNLLGFSQAVYTVAESEGQVEVCVNSFLPVVRDALATIISIPQSATGMHFYTV